MNESERETLSEGLAEAIAGTFALHPQPLYVHHGRVSLRHSEIRTRLLEATRGLSAISVFQNGAMRAGNFSSSTSVDAALDWLFNASMQHGIQEAIDRLDRFLSGGKTEAVQVAVIRGIRVDRVVALSDSLSLCPNEEAPIEAYRHAYGIYMARAAQMGAAPIPVHDLEFNVFAHTMLVRRHSLPGTVAEAVGEELRFEFPTHTDYGASELVEALDLLVLYGPSYPQIVESWDRVEDHVPLSGYLGGIWRKSQPELLGDPMLKELTAEQLSDFPELFGRFRLLPKETKSLLRLVCQRLGASVGRRSAVDQAIELGVALEALVMNGKKNPQITLALKVRGANILAGGIDERKRIAAALDSFYNMRSDAVHTGLVASLYKHAGAKVAPQAILDEARGLCISIAKVIINLGRLPDWSMVELGGQP